jgi:hypothetical protein
MNPLCSIGFEKSPGAYDYDFILLLLITSYKLKEIRQLADDALEDAGHI